MNLRFLKIKKAGKCRAWVTFCGILLLAFLIRWIYGELHPAFRRDEIYYLKMAEYLAEHGQYPKHYGQQPPLLVFVLHWVCSCGLDLDWAARWVTRIAGLFFVVPWWWIGKYLFTNPRGHMLLMFLMAIAPYPVFLSNQVLREAFSLPIAAWFLLILLSYWNNSKKWQYVLIGGIVCAFGNCCRYEFGELLLVFLGSIIWACYRQKISFLMALGQLFLLFGTWLIGFIIFLYGMKIDAFSWFIHLATVIRERVC